MNCTKSGCDRLPTAHIASPTHPDMVYRVCGRHLREAQAFGLVQVPTADDRVEVVSR